MCKKAVSVMNVVQLVKDNKVQEAIDMLHEASKESVTLGLSYVAQAAELLEGAESRRLISGLALYQHSKMQAANQPAVPAAA